MSGLRRFLRGNSLGLAFGGLFLVCLVGQAVAGHLQYNHQQAAADLPAVSLLRYLTSASFAADVMENWQSEYLQFLLYVLGTVWLIQRGSPGVKPAADRGRESDQQQQVGPYARADSPAWARTGGWRTAVYSNSLGLVMGAIFLLTWLAQSVAGCSAYNEEQLRDLQAPLAWHEYLLASDFWSRTLQNWQSEVLAVGSFAVIAVYLRQRGSPESKPVGAPHADTGSEG